MLRTILAGNLLAIGQASAKPLGWSRFYNTRLLHLRATRLFGGFFAVRALPGEHISSVLSFFSHLKDPDLQIGFPLLSIEWWKYIEQLQGHHADFLEHKVWTA